MFLDLSVPQEVQWDPKSPFSLLCVYMFVSMLSSSHLSTFSFYLRDCTSIPLLFFSIPSIPVRGKSFLFLNKPVCYTRAAILPGSRVCVPLFFLHPFHVYQENYYFQKCLILIKFTLFVLPLNDEELKIQKIVPKK